MLIFIIVLTLILLTAAALSYHRTVPIIPLRLRVLLSGLRIIAFLFITLLLIDPRCMRQDRMIDPALVAILVDQSSSMSLPVVGWDSDGGYSRFEMAHRLAGSVADQIQSRGGECMQFYFSNDLLPSSPDTVRPTGQGTSIIRSLKTLYTRLEGENLSAIILMSDGIETGTSILRADPPPIPVFAVGLGDTAYPEDVSIKEVDYSGIVRVPSKTTIRPTVSCTGGGARMVRLKLFENDQMIYSKNLRMGPGNRDVSEEIEIDMTKPGRRTFLIQIDVDGFDVEKENNRREIIIDAEKAEVKLLIVDMHPGWEHHFLTGVLRKDDTFSFDVLSKNINGHHIIAPKDFESRLEGYDALILCSLDADFPSEREAALIRNFVETDGKGLLVLPGPASLFEYRRPWRLLESILPVQTVPPLRFTFAYTSVAPGPQCSSNPITAELHSDFALSDWQERSPLLGFYQPLQVKAGAQVLLTSHERSAPILVYGRFGEGRIAIMASGPLWRWKFLPEEGRVYDALVSRLLEVLSRGETSDRFLLAVKKSVFDAGEPPVLFADIFDKKMQPVTSVPVRVAVSKVEGNVEIPLRTVSMEREGAQSTRFKAFLEPLPPGTYRLKGEAELEDRLLASSPLEIKVSSVSVEYRRVHQDRDMLSSIARRTEGSVSMPDEMDRLAASIPLERRETDIRSEVTLRTSAIVFALILLVLSLEWIIRKRAGMV